MPPTVTTHPPGRERRAPLEDHEARTAVRLLVARVLDSIDRGDAVGLSECFGVGGSWCDPSGTTWSGTALGDHLARWRAVVPWSAHWFANEGVFVDRGTATGHFLWFAASLEPGGEPVWSGGDLDVVAAAGSSGWRLTTLAMTDRYRTSWSQGWLDEPERPLPTMPPVADAPAATVAPPHGTTDVPLPLAPSAATEDERTDALAAEVDVRNLVATVVGAIEVGDVDRALAGLAPGATMRDADDQVVEGDELRRRLDAEAERGAGLLRALTSTWCRVDAPGRARVGWRDLSTAVVDGRATWIGASWTAEATSDGGPWMLRSLVRRDLLSSPYLPPWSAGPVEGEGR